MRHSDTLIGNSRALAGALEHLSQLARIHRPVLIVGERGTGKELAAARLHYLSPRWQAPLLKVNCATLSEELLDSELFGHEAGAFTGAIRARQGRFERADGGTLFLDELGSMSLRLQEKLLRVVEYGELERLGGQRTLQVDVRIVAATNTDLRRQVAEQHFRADLLDRLCFDVVSLPPLRERPEDIVELAQHFAVQMSADLGWDLFPGFTPGALAALRGYHWPGNVRELKNVVERSLFRWDPLRRPVDAIIIDPFPPASGQHSPPLAPVDADTAPQSREHAAAPGNWYQCVREFERQRLLEALVGHQFNQRATAAALGLSYDQLRGMVRKYKLSRPRH